MCPQRTAPSRLVKLLVDLVLLSAIDWGVITALRISFHPQRCLTVLCSGCSPGLAAGLSVHRTATVGAGSSAGACWAMTGRGSRKATVLPPTCCIMAIPPLLLLTCAAAALPSSSPPPPPHLVVRANRTHT
jgi:hypothetical protein